MCIVCSAATSAGNVELLQWLQAEGCPWDEYTCTSAAEKGHLSVLQWLRSQGCPWSGSVCSVAAFHGHLHILQWARDNHCPWDEFSICHTTTSGRHMYVVEWLLEHGHCSLERLLFCATHNNATDIVARIQQHTATSTSTSTDS